MSEYKDPIQINANDPICSASALNGTVIGILFEKKGSEIQDAIRNRVQLIDKKTDELNSTIKETDEFLEKKEKEIIEIDDFYMEQADKKNAELKPYQRKAEDIQKDINDIIFRHGKETEKMVAGKAVEFEKGFKEIEKKFDDIDTLLETEKKKSLPIRSQSVGNTRTWATGNDSLTTNGDAGMGTPSPSSILHVTTQEDKALSRLNTLKGTVREYRNKIERILLRIKELEEEKRRLTLISRNLNSDREYKLDLNKLSAFGFEDIEITA